MSKLMVVIWFLIFSFLSRSMADEKPDWFCTSQSGKRDGNVLSSCGMGEAFNEPDARNYALRRAIMAYEYICRRSDDCKGHKLSIEPKRMSCYKAMEPDMFGEMSMVWRCYHLLEVTISDERQY